MNPLVKVLNSGMNNSSKKMGIVGAFLAWLFVSSIPEEQKAILGLILIGSYIAVQGMSDWVGIWFNPKGLTIDNVVKRLSKKMTAATGYLGFILQSELSDELKMKFGLAIVLLWLVVQGIHDGIKAVRLAKLHPNHEGGIVPVIEQN